MLLTEEEGDTGVSDLDRAMACEHTKLEGLQWDRRHDNGYDSAITESWKMQEGGRNSVYAFGCGVAFQMRSDLDHRSGGG